MITLAKLLYRATKYRFFLVFFLLVWIVGWSLFLTQTLFSVRQELDDQALENIGGDLVINQSLPLDTSMRERIDGVVSRAARDVLTSSYTISMFTTLSIRDDRSVDPILASVRGVDTSYPLYGELILQTLAGTPYTGGLGSGVWLSQDLLDAFLGDAGEVPRTVTLGDVDFPILGRVVAFPGSSFSLFDRGRTLLLDRSGLEDNALLGLGSRISHEYAYRFGSATSFSIISLREELDTLLPNAEIETVSDARQNFQRFFSQLDSIVYVGVIALFFLTYAGLALVTSLMVSATKDTFRVVGLLGVSSGRIIRTLVFLGSVVFLVSSIVGGRLGYVGWTLLPRSTFGVVPEWSALPVIIVCTQMLALFVSVSFLWFSSAIRYRGVVVLIVALFGILYARFGLSLQIFFIVISVCFPVVFFYGLTKVLLRLGRLRANHSIAVRGLRPLTWVMRRADQPGSSMIVIGTVFSLLLCVLGTVAMIQYAFIDYLQDFQATDQPNTFILNITESTRSLVQTSLPDAQFYDTILARILRVNEVGLRDYLDQRGMPYGRFSREFNMTTVSLADEIAGGSATLLPGMISVDSDTAADLGIRIGDMLTLGLVGREFVLRVGQLRNVERSQLQPFFFFQLHPDDMVGAPRTYFSLVSLDPGDRPEVLRLLLAQTSGQLSFIEVDAIVDQIKQLVLVVVGSMSVVGMSILVIGFVLALLCMITVLDEQKRDGVLLQLLGVTNSWVSRACIFALWYPIVLVVLSSLLVLGILGLLFSSMQSFIPLTGFHILGGMVVVCLFLGFFMLLVVLTRFRSLLR